MKKIIVSLLFLAIVTPFVQMFAVPIYVPTSCGVVYTDTDYWTAEELLNLGDYLEAICDQEEEDSEILVD